MQERGKKQTTKRTQSSNLNINITQINTYIGEFSKRHPIITILITILSTFWLCIQINEYFANKIYSKKIYLSLWETGKKVPINDSNIEIPSIVPINYNTPVTLRFLLTQDNVNSPQITSILLTFPDDAIVEPIPYEGWAWARNNDVSNTYFINFSPLQIIASGVDCNLPVFKIVFKKAGLLPFIYRINGNKIKSIRKEFIINTELKYEQWLTNKQNYDLFYDDSVSASSSVVSGSMVTFDPPIAENTK